MTGPADDIQGNQEDPLRRRFRKLPPVKAAPDFEVRLERRLARQGPAEERRGLWQRLFPPRRVPAFAYSLIALVVVGFVSYYMFRTTAIVPETEQEIVSPREPGGRVNLPEGPVFRQGEAAASEEDRKLQKPATATESGVKRKDVSPPARIESKSDRLRPGDERSGNAREVSVPASQNAVSPSARQIEVQENISGDTQKGGAGVSEPERVLGLPPVSRSVQAPGEFRMQMKSLAAPPVSDSARVRDSLRLDSIKQAEQSRRPQVRQGKVKKPGG